LTLSMRAAKLLCLYTFRRQKRYEGGK